MIFREELIPKILAGEKTVTRRPVKERPVGQRSILRWQPCKYKPGGGPGGTYALQGPPEKWSKARARTIPGYRLRVVSVFRHPLSGEEEWMRAAAYDEPRREGFDDWREFRDYWIALYGSYDPTQPVDRIEFELVPVSEPGEMARAA